MFTCNIDIDMKTFETLENFAFLICLSKLTLSGTKQKMRLIYMKTKTLYNIGVTGGRRTKAMKRQED